jgi:hypothetical protein
MLAILKPYKKPPVNIRILCLALFPESNQAYKMEYVFEIDALILIECGDQFLLSELFVEPVVEPRFVVFQD